MNHYLIRPQDGVIMPTHHLVTQLVIIQTGEEVIHKTSFLPIL